MLNSIRVIRAGKVRVDLCGAPISRREREQFFIEASGILETAQGMLNPDDERRKEYDDDWQENRRL